MKQFFNNLVSHTQRSLLAGLLITAPLGITIWVLVTLTRLADGILKVLPEPARPEYWLGHSVPGLGVVLSLLVILMVGYATQYYTGRRVIEFYETLLARVPILSTLYKGVKQLVGTLFKGDGEHFREVVLVEYPRRDVYCLAFLTNRDPKICIDSIPDSPNLISVFLPTTPNPTSGFFLLLPMDEVRRVDMTVEEAFKVIISAGIVAPTDARVASLDLSLT